MQIGFLGLGKMGAPMARNLVAAGHAVKGFDPEVRPEGLASAQSALEAAIGARVVFLMLPDGATVRSVVTSVLDALAANTILCDCSTIGPAAARELATLAATHRIPMIDAPVSGGIDAAQAGTLTFMAGGDTDAFATLNPLLHSMGERALHCGASGAGQSAAICNSIILGATMIATCEAIALADKLGLGRRELHDVVASATGQSWSMTTHCPAPGIGPGSPADNDYRPGFAAESMLKDLRLAQQAAEAADADTPMGTLAEQLYARFVEDEDGRGRDLSAMLSRFEKRERA